MPAVNRNSAEDRIMTPRRERERRHLYAMLHMWDDEETQILPAVTMADLVDNEANADEQTKPLDYTRRHA